MRCDKQQLSNRGPKYCGSNSGPFSTNVKTQSVQKKKSKQLILCEGGQFKMAQNTISLLLWKEDIFFKSSAGGLLWKSEQAVDPKLSYMGFCQF
jgi:hypothetical protein